MNGAFLAAGLIDAVSTLICPAIDALSGVSSIYEHDGPPGSHPAAGTHLHLVGSETLDGGVVWLRHEVVRR
jgi:5-amino-6-(5-phosphoribosylamino)uracil reductase